MEKIIVFIISFIIVYLFYFVTIIRREKNLKKLKDSKQAFLFKQLYKIKTNKIDNKIMANTIAISNSFIIAVAVLILEFVDNLILKMVVGAIIIIPIILLTYFVASKYLQTKDVK